MEMQAIRELFFSKPYSFIKKLPGIKSLIKTTAWRKLRFKIALLTDSRPNNNFTRFLRLPTQFEALSGPVIDFLFMDRTKKKLKITVLGCSSGAEPYSIASVLRNRHPDLPFAIYAYDIDRASIDKAINARYAYEEVFKAEYMTADFVNATFDREKDFFIIKNDIRKSVHFDVTDVLNPELKERLGTSDIVYAQHMLIHLKPHKAVQAFNNICNLLNPKAALFIAGIELDILAKMTRKNNLMPLEYKIENIYKEVETYGPGWPYIYFGVEPFMTVKKDWKRRYSTIFLKT
jgi:chemotaxis protein methyltransferase CheR